MPKIPKKTLAMRNPVVGEFMRGLFGLDSDLSAKKLNTDSRLTSPK